MDLQVRPSPLAVEADLATVRFPVRQSRRYLWSGCRKSDRPHRNNEDSSMSTLISLFNHKGGVSKTTTAFNLGWAMAERGKRVLIVDGDPQCNLTGTVLGFGGIDELSVFYSDNPKTNISDCLDPIFQGSGETLTPANVAATPHENMFLLPGNIDLAENETQIAVALSASSAIPALQNIPGAPCALIRMTAEEKDIDVVIVDMSPSVGALNQCLLMGSDYFIVPTSPDYYCNQAIISLSRVVPRWHGEIDTFRAGQLIYPFPSRPPKFCGIISQRYRPRLGNPAQSFQQWIDTIKATVLKQFIPPLKRHRHGDFQRGLYPVGCGRHAIQSSEYRGFQFAHCSIAET